MSKSHPKQKSWLDTLRLSDEQYEALLGELSQAQAQPAGPELRQSVRVPFNDRRGVLMRVKNPGGTLSHFRVKPRDLSTGGMAVLHGGFIHTGARCAIPLPTPDGGVQLLEGHVVRCRHIRGNVHEVGIQFAKAIDVSRYAADASPAGESPPPTPLSGTALCVDASAEGRRQLKADLQNAGLDAAAVASADTALNLIGRQHFDIVAVATDAGGRTLGDFVRDARGAGYDRYLLAVLDQGDEAPPATQAGADAVLYRPYQPDELHEALRRHLNADTSDAADHGEAA